MPALGSIGQSPNSAKPRTQPSNQPNIFSTGHEVPLPDGAEGGEAEGAVAFPFLLEGFPAFQPVSFPTINQAPFNFTDPLDYAKKIQDLNQLSIGKNFDQARKMALDTLSTELQGLRGYAPAAASLAREQASIDNQFNQAQRSAQIKSVLPEAAGDLAAQRKRALSYAEGRLPDAMTDRALELGIRSSAADRATFSGFGPKSGQGVKLSDLMSAEQRFQIGQYGEGLLGQNLSTKANLMLAPTEYINAGQQIKVNPPISPSALTYQGLGALNEATLLAPGAILNAQIGQEQFATNLTQHTSEFNAMGKFDASKFNSAGAFTAALGAFQYDVSYLNAVQGAQQSQLNFASGVQFQGLQNQSMNTGLSNAQNAQTVQSVFEGIGTIAGATSAIQGALGSPAPSSATTPSADSVGSTSVAVPAQQALSDTAPLNSTVSLSSNSIPSTAQSLDASIPSGVKFSQGTEMPSGYVPIQSNNDGTVTAIPAASYTSDLERFSRSGRIASGEVSPQNAAAADKAISNSVGLSYLPIPGFKPVVTSSTGKTMYSLPALANSSNTEIGRDNIASLVSSLATLGESDPAVYSAVGKMGATVSDTKFLTTLDKLSNEEGPASVSKAIQNKLLGKSVDTKSPEGQQFKFAAARIGEIWDNLSPAQKSMALTSLTSPAIKLLSGKDPANEVIPGTVGGINKGLRRGDAVTLTMNGLNGFALARNWKQLSTVADLVTGDNGAVQIARLADSAGLLGFGAEGAAVPVPAGYLEKAGAQAAPEFGIGAVVFNKSNQVPKNYKSITQTPDGKIVAMPANLLDTSPLIHSSPQPLVFKKMAEIGIGKHPAQKLWGQSPTKGIVKGSVGGSAMASGLNIMSKANPPLHSSLVAHSMFQNLIGKNG